MSDRNSFSVNNLRPWETCNDQECQHGNVLIQPIILCLFLKLSVVPPYHQKFQVPKLEVLSLIFGHFRGGFLHFRYLNFVVPPC